MKLIVFLLLITFIIINVITIDAYKFKAHQKIRANMKIAAQYPNNTDDTFSDIEDTPKQYVLYKQCSSPWGTETLGTGSDTICAAGCAMSSVSMILATWGEKVNGQTTNPGTLNTWLINNGGYASGDLIVWASINKLGTVQFSNIYSGTGSLSAEELRSNVDKSKPTVVNVRDGAHWVLVVGYQSNSSTEFMVNDPGFSQTSYEYSCMSNYVVYSAPSITTTSTTSATTTTSSSSSPSSATSSSSPSSSSSSSPSSSSSSSSASATSSSTSPSSATSSSASSSSSPSTSSSPSASSSPSSGGSSSPQTSAQSGSVSTAGRLLRVEKQRHKKKC